MTEEHVAVLMCTYNGAQFLPQQLESLASQSVANWSLWVSDDGSFDSTYEIISNFSTCSAQSVTWINGPKKGFCKNFLSLLAREEINADYYFFSDQDDVWHQNKIARAIDWLKEQPEDKPALYCSRTHLVDQEGNSLGCSPHFARKPSFANAIVQSIGGGNTMAMNNAMRKILVMMSEEACLRSHDWWAYIVATAVGASVHYDSKPSIDYRQHGSNQVGSNTGIVARLCRLRLIMSGEFSVWNTWHVKQLEAFEHMFTENTRRQLLFFKNLKSENIFCRIVAYVQGKFYRQNYLDNIWLFIMVLLRRV